MNPLAQMNQAMDYLEVHLTDVIDFGQMARCAGCSEYHFRRMFSYLAGMPLGEYIRCRKLALAGTLLMQGYKAMDCAVLLGYDSADAFGKAFQGMHGVAPSEAKRASVVLKAFPPMTFQLTITGGCKMDYRIVHNGRFQIVGFKKRIFLQFEGVNPQMNSLYEKLTPERIAELKGLSHENKGVRQPHLVGRSLGIASERKRERHRFSHLTKAQPSHEVWLGSLRDIILRAMELPPG